MSATTEIESQRKGWFRWYRTDIAWVSLDANYSISYSVRGPNLYVYTETLSGSYNHKKYNASEIRKNFTWGVSAGGWFNLSGWISSSYEGLRINKKGSCSTYVKK